MKNGIWGDIRDYREGRSEERGSEKTDEERERREERREKRAERREKREERREKREERREKRMTAAGASSSTQATSISSVARNSEGSC